MQGNLNTYSSLLPVTPSDSTSINCSAIYVGGAGTLVVTPGLPYSGSAVSFLGVPAGSIVPINLLQGRINAASTATGIVALA
jgi:hypothetical protein